MSIKNQTENLSDSKDVKHVEIESAVALSEKQLEKLRTKLSEILKTDQFVLQVKVNPSLFPKFTLLPSSSLTKL